MKQSSNTRATAVRPEVIPMRVTPTIAIRSLAALLTGLLGLGASEFAPADINELIRFRGVSEAPPVKEVRQAAVA